MTAKPPPQGVTAAGLGAGEIIHLDFTPSADHEIRGPHFALVVSLRAFNSASGLAWVCPISQGEAAAHRAGGFLVTLMGAGTQTVGSIQVHQLRVVDCRERAARRVEKVPRHVIDEVQSIISAATGIG